MRNSQLQKVTVNKLAYRRTAKSPMREPGGGPTVSVEVMTYGRETGKGASKRDKMQRRADADARKAEFDKLTLQQKLDRLPKDGANRQRARYTALLAKRAEAKALADKVENKVARTEEAAKQTDKQRAKRQKTVVTVK